MLKEDFLSIAFPIALIAGMIWKNIYVNKRQYEPSENVINAINDIWNDRQFVTTFVKIVSKVSNYEEIISKINKNVVNSRPYTLDAQKWWDVNGSKFKIDVNINKVITQLEKTPQYKSMVKKYNFTEDDVKDFRKVLYITATRNDILKYSKEIFDKSIEKAINSKEFIKTGDLTRAWQSGS